MRAMTRYLPALLVAFAASAAAAGAGLDLHWLWDDRCATCHGHSADLARRLNVVDGELAGHRRGAGLRRFLHNHYAPDSEVGAIYAMLLAQAQTPPRFREQCRGCHGRAADLVRSSVVLRDGAAFTAAGQPLESFLAGHVRPDRKDVDFYARLLERIAREVHRR